MDTNWLLIGIGNEYRSDDGIALSIVSSIQELNLPNVLIKEESGEGAALMEAWLGYDNVILIDAVSSGAKPGTIFRIEAHKEKIPAKFFHYSTHLFGAAEAIELARSLHKIPQKLIIFGIEGINFNSGLQISPVVMEAGKKIIEHVLTEINQPQ